MGMGMAPSFTEELDDNFVVFYAFNNDCHWASHEHKTKKQ